MFCFKIILLVSLLTPGILGLSCLDKEDEVIKPEVLDVIPDTPEVKINWGPVWDDIEGNNEFVVRNIAKEEDSQNCEAPNGLGLKNLFIEVEKRIPKERIDHIIKSYADDNELKNLLDFIKQPQNHAKVKAILNSPEYQVLREYSCRILHLDLLKYQQLTRTLLLHPLQSSLQENSKGIRGLINEIHASLPHQQFRELYQELLTSDEELVKAVANLKSEKFHRLLLDVKNKVPEYKDLEKQLSALGVPVEEMCEMFCNAMGWTNSDDKVVFGLLV